MQLLDALAQIQGPQILHEAHTLVVDRKLDRLTLPLSEACGGHAQYRGKRKHTLPVTQEPSPPQSVLGAEGAAPEEQKPPLSGTWRQEEQVASGWLTARAPLHSMSSSPAEAPQASPPSLPPCAGARTGDERHGFMGGMSTAALVSPWIPSTTGRESRSSTVSPRGRRSPHGLGARRTPPRHDWLRPFADSIEPDSLRILADAMLGESGFVLHHGQVFRVERRDRRSLVWRTDSWRGEDVPLLYCCGRHGRRHSLLPGRRPCRAVTGRNTQPMTMCFRMASGLSLIERYMVENTGFTLAQ